MRQCVQCRLAVAVADHANEPIHERRSLLRPGGNRDGPAMSLRRTQPGPQTAVGHTVDPAHARQPVAKTGQRTDRIPPQRCRRHDPVAFDIHATAL